MKTTGANFDSSMDNLKQQQLSGLPMSSPLVKNKESEEVGSMVDSDSQDEASSEAQASVNANELKNQETSVKAVGLDTTGMEVPTLECCSPESSDDDIDFLDLLVDSLDGEFDPDLLI